MIIAYMSSKQPNYSESQCRSPGAGAHGAGRVKARTMEWENTALGNLFVPDVLTPEQFYDSRRDDSSIRPVKKLMMAILEDALRCFQNNADAKGGPRKRLFSEAEQWLIGEGGEGPFSFETVCETLGIEPQFLRRGLRDWRSQQLAGVSTRRLARRSPVVRSGRISAPARRDAKRTARAR